jgi:hypothetical protein
MESQRERRTIEGTVTQDYLHIKCQPLWARWQFISPAAMVQLRKRLDLARSNGMSIGKECIWPLLEQAVHRSKVVGCFRGEV